MKRVHRSKRSPDSILGVNPNLPVTRGWLVPQPWANDKLVGLLHGKIGSASLVAAVLRKRLDGVKAERCPVARTEDPGAVWVSPDLRARITYRGKRTAGELRHASFKGLEE